MYAGFVRSGSLSSTHLSTDLVYDHPPPPPNGASGLAAIREGKVAALVLSGGQGTRLGFDGPKGMYDIGLPSGKPIFQLLAERVRGLSRLARMPPGRTLPFYVMTSPLNHDATRCVRRVLRTVVQSKFLADAPFRAPPFSSRTGPSSSGTRTSGWTLRTSSSSLRAPCRASPWTASS